MLKNDGLILILIYLFTQKNSRNLSKQILNCGRKRDRLCFFDKDLREKIVFDSNKGEKSRKFHKKNDTKFFANLFVESFAKIFQNAGHHNFPKDQNLYLYQLALITMSY